MERAVRLLLVDADDCRRSDTKVTLEGTSLKPSVSTAATTTKALKQLHDGSVDCIVSAFELGDGDGVSFLEHVRDNGHSIPFVLFSESESPDVARDVFAAENTDYLPNVPGVERVLGSRIENLIESEKRPPERYGTETTELEHERERFLDLFSNFPEPTVAYGLHDGVAVFKAVNDAFESVFGHSDEEIRDTSVNELIVPDDVQTESEQIDDQVDSGDMVDRVVRRLAADGPRIFNLRSIPVSAAGEIDGFAVYSDITERKHRERELERYETIVQTIPMGVLTVEEDWHIGNINEPGAEILGYSVDDLVGEPFIKLQTDGVITENETALAEHVVDELWSTSEVRKKAVEVTVTTQSEVTRELEVHTSLLPSEEEFSGVVLVFHDITDRKESERELRRQNERLEEFASIVSHDLRNPLNVAMGHLEIIRDDYESPSVEHVADALDRMETLIRETLQLAKQGKMVTDTKPIRLSDITTNCWQMIDRDDAALECSSDVQFYGDPSRVRQLFENLFRNAIEHGGSDVTVRVGAENGMIFVEDNGSGIPPEERESVFETGHTTSEDGTGFGLAIVEQIVDAHDWNIRVSEGTAGGARFEITGFEQVSNS